MMDWESFNFGLFIGAILVVLIGLLIRIIYWRRLREWQQRAYMSRFGGVV